MAQRGISLDAVETALSQTPFPYFHEGVWKLGYYYAGTFVGTLNGVTTTVINSVKPSYINNLQGQTP